MLLYTSFRCGDGVFLNTEGSWGSKGSCHSELDSGVGMGWWVKPRVVGVVRVIAIQICVKGGDGVSLKTKGSWGSQGSSHKDSVSRVGPSLKQTVVVVVRVVVIQI